jgi:hypothetical protein
MSDIDFLMENYGDGVSAFVTGIQLAEPGTYRCMASEFRILKDYGAIVIPFLIASNPDNTESEFKGVEVSFWLSLKSKQAAHIAGERLKPMGLTFPDSFRSPDNRLPEILTVIATVEKRADDKTKDSDNPTFKNTIGKVREVLNRTPQVNAKGFMVEGFE